MAQILQFPSPGFKAKGGRTAKALYSASEVSRLCGLSEGLIRRWTREGVVPCAPHGSSEQAHYNDAALELLRRARELQSAGFSPRRITQELHGQLNLFFPPTGETPSTDTTQLFERALQAFDTGSPQARSLFEQCVEQGIAVADSLCNLGVLAAEEGRREQALTCFMRALKEDPRHFESHYNLANLYFDMGKYVPAREHYRIAGTLQPEFANLYFNLGLVLAALGDLAGAVEAMQQFQRACATAAEAGSADAVLATLKTAQALLSRMHS